MRGRLRIADLGGAPRKAWGLTLFGWIWRDARVLCRRRSFDQLNGRCARSIDRAQATFVLLLDESLDLLLAPTLLALAPLAKVVVPALSPTCGTGGRHLPMTLESRWHDSIREDWSCLGFRSFARGRELGLRRPTLGKVDLPGACYTTSTDMTARWRELTSRAAHGVHVRLLWAEPEGRCSVAVTDITPPRRSDRGSRRRAGARRFHHPYTYAAWHGLRLANGPDRLIGPRRLSASC